MTSGPITGALRLGVALALALAVNASDAAAAGKASGAAAGAKKRCIASAENGQTLRASGHLVDARASFAQCTAAECPGPVRKDCGHWMEELDAATPSFSLRLEDPSGNEVETASVQVDGKPLVPSDHGRSTPIDPGTHVFEWTRPEGVVRVEAVLHDGEQNKIVLLRAPGPPGAGGGVVAGNGTDGGTEGTWRPVGSGSGTYGTTGSTSAARPSAAPWIVSGGIALVSASVGFALWGVGSSEHSDLENGCAVTHGCSSSDVNRSRDKLIEGDVLVGVGIAAAAVSFYFILKNRGDGRAHTSSNAPAVAPLVTASGAGFTF